MTSEAHIQAITTIIDNKKRIIGKDLYYGMEVLSKCPYMKFL